jgi:hypothetical protein
MSWLVLPTALALAMPWEGVVPSAVLGMVLLWALAMLAVIRGMPALLVWSAGTRSVLDPLVALTVWDLGYLWACAAFLADAAMVMVVHASLPWLGRAAQGTPCDSDNVHVRSYLFEVSKPLLAALAAFVASIACAIAAKAFDLGAAPLAVVAVAGVIAIASMAALLTWSSKGL